MSDNIEPLRISIPASKLLQIIRAFDRAKNPVIPYTPDHAKNTQAAERIKEMSLQEAEMVLLNALVRNDAWDVFVRQNGGIKARGES